MLDVTKTGNEQGEQENEKWEQNKELEMKLLIGLGFKWSFVSIFHFPVPRARFPLPVPRFSNIPVCPQILHKLMLLGGLHFPIRGGGGWGEGANRGGIQKLSILGLSFKYSFVLMILQLRLLLF